MVVFMHSKIVRFYNYLNEDLTDPRTADMFLVRSPLTLIGILIIYVNFVTKWGPRLMKNREAFNLRTTMIIYNVVQILLNMFIFIQAFRHGWGGKYSYICEPIDYSVSPENEYVCGLCHLYFIIKLADLIDTVFMVLRKREDHISFLHVYHHAGMCMLAWGGVKYLAGGHGTFLGFINSFVHAVMYCYYLLTSISPQFTQSIWWKKYLTQLQMVQFLMVSVHMSLIAFQPNCAYPKFVIFLLVPQNIFMFVLFCDFYYKAYVKKGKQSPAAVNSSPAPHSNTNNVKRNTKLRVE